MAVRKRGEKWYIDIYVDGKRIWRVVPVKSKKEAKEIEEDLKRSIRHQELGLKDFKDAPTFDFVAQEYLEYLKGTMAPRTHAIDATDYRVHLCEYFGHLRIKDISNDTLMRYQTLKKAQKHHNVKPYSNRTVNIHVGLVRKIMGYAEDKGYVRDIKLKYPMLPESQRLHAFLTPDEMDAFLENFQSDLAYKRVLFEYMTGLRPKEVAYLAWSDIDIEGKTIKITSKPPDFIIKTKQERIVPLNKTATEIIMERHKVRGEGEWVFSDNGRPVKSAIKAIKTAARRAGIKKKVTPNMLRHSFATHAIMGGADIKHVSAILGHSSLETTAKYLHSIDGQLRKTVDIISMGRSEKYGSKNGSK